MNNPATAVQRMHPLTNEPIPTINLGDVAKDTISGFQGVVTSKTQTINGAERCQLSAQFTDAKGNPRSSSFDLRQLELIRAAVMDTKYPT